MAREVGVEAPRPRGVERKELSREYGDERREELRHVRKRHRARTLWSDEEQVPRPRFQLSRGRRDFRRRARPRRSDEEDRQVLVDHGDRPVLEVRRGVGLSEKERELLELQRDLVRGRKVQAAREDDGASRAAEVRGRLLGLLFL